MNDFFQGLLDLVSGAEEFTIQKLVDELVKILDGLFNLTQEKLD